MATVLPPVRDDISGTAPNPSNAVARTAFGVLHDYLMNLLGSAGTPAAARTALGSTATGDALFTTTSTTTARATLDVYSTTESGTATASAITAALNTPVVAATISASQTITSSTHTKVNFDTVTVNKVGTFSTSDKRWTPGVVGTVRISSSVNFSISVGASTAILSIYKNGAVLKRLNEMNGTNITGMLTGSAIVETTATDYFEIYAYITATTPQITGTSIGIYASAFDGEFIRT